MRKKAMSSGGKIMNDEIVVIDTIFGSHLYGTNDENSDMDYKRIVIPDKRDVILGRVFKSRHENTKSGDGKNTRDDTDVETISLHYFFKLLCEGQTMALDILHAEPEDGKDTDVWRALRENREMFYTSKMSAFMGYAQHQAAKYGLRSGRLGNVREVIKFLKENK
jgi:predicted nucleotidyltransferase